MPLQALVFHTVHGPVRGGPRAAGSAIGSRAIGTITALSSTEWRVSGAAGAVGSASAELGYIQLCSGVYEVTRIGGSVIEFSTVRSLPEAVASLTAKPRRRLTLVTESTYR